jgi:hypothetical protein
MSTCYFATIILISSNAGPYTWRRKPIFRLMLAALMLCILLPERSRAETVKIRLQAQVNSSSQLTGIVANPDDCGAIHVIPGDVIIVEPLSNQPFLAEIWYQTFQWTKDRKSGKDTIHEHFTLPVSQPWQLTWSGVAPILKIANVTINPATVPTGTRFTIQALANPGSAVAFAATVPTPNRSVARPPTVPTDAKELGLTTMSSFKNDDTVVTLQIEIRHAGQ